MTTVLAEMPPKLVIAEACTPMAKARISTAGFASVNFPATSLAST